ncbi:MAG: IclR family transcriptional regulator [Pseudomonadota bacterium]|nr:IclR family transcriptional regulator [Pseudomonadota bacterium]
MGNPRRSADAFAGGIDQDHPQFVNAVARAFSILRCFEHGEPHLGNQDIVRRTGLPKPTVSRLTFTLSALGYLEYSPTLEKYALGTAVLALGHAFMKSNDVVAIARPLMRELAAYTESAVMLGAADGPRMVLLEVCQGDTMFQLRIEPGARVPHGSTALGRADLAARPLPLFEQSLAELERECEPPLWPKIRAGIVRARQDYENYGFCFSLGDWNPDVFAVGVPMVSADRNRILAFNCSGRVSVMTREKLIRDFGPRLVALRNTVYELTEGRF